MKKIVIDLTQKRLDESWYSSFAGDIASILKAIGAGNTLPATVKGSTADIKAFARLMGMETKYMNAYEKYGLGNPAAFRTKSELDRAVRDFERTTGIKYPFK